MESLTFHLSNGRFAIPLQRIDELLPMMAIRLIPDVPGFIYGGINLRGDFLPVIDLVERLGGHWRSPPPPINHAEMERSHFTQQSRLIIVRQHQHRYAVIIDGVERIEDYEALVTRSNITVEGVHPDYLQGMILSNEEMIQLVLIDQLLSEQELSMLSLCSSSDQQDAPPSISLN